MAGGGVPGLPFVYQMQILRRWGAGVPIGLHKKTGLRREQPKPTWLEFTMWCFLEHLEDEFWSWFGIQATLRTNGE